MNLRHLLENQQSAQRQNRANLFVHKQAAPFPTENKTTNKKSFL